MQKNDAYAVIDIKILYEQNSNYKTHNYRTHNYRTHNFPHRMFKASNFENNYMQEKIN